MYKDVTRGGQTSIHQFRMMRQVIYSGVLFSFIIGAIYIGWSLYSQPKSLWIDTYEYYTANLCNKIIPAEKQHNFMLNYKDGKGRTYKRSSYSIANDYTLKTSVHQLKAVLVEMISKFITVSAISFGFIISFWLLYGSKHRKKKVQRGSKVVDSRTMLLKLKLSNNASSYKIGELPLEKSTETQHILLTGTTGSGKSNTIKSFVQQIRANKDNGVIIDTTGEYVDLFYDEGKDILLMPGNDSSKNWNLFDECTEPRDTEVLAEALIPSRGFSDPFWSDASKTLFSAAVSKLLNTENANHKTLFEYLAICKLKELETFLEHTEAAQLISAKNDKTSLSVRATMTPYIKFLKYIDSAGDIKSKDTAKSFSIKDWIQSDKKEGSLLFLSCKGDQRSIYVPLISAWMNIALNSLLGGKINNARKTWFVLDELSSLQSLPSLPPLLAEGRKYGACCLVGTQTINQILDIYQVYKGKTLLSLFNTKVFFKCSEPDTQSWITKCLGEYEEEEYIENISYGAHQMRDGISLANSIKTKPIIIPSELSSLKVGEAFIKFPSGLVSKIITKEVKI